MHRLLKHFFFIVIISLVVVVGFNYITINRELRDYQGSIGSWIFCWKNNGFYEKSCSKFSNTLCNSGLLITKDPGCAFGGN